MLFGETESKNNLIVAKQRRRRNKNYYETETRWMAPSIVGVFRSFVISKMIY